MNRTKPKRLLSLLLSLAMICVFVYVPVSAEDTITEISEPEEITALELEDVEEIVVDADDAEEIAYDADAEVIEEDYGIAAISEDDEEGDDSSITASALPTADENNTITLTGDVALTEQYTVDTDLTIDLNGHSITRSANSGISYLISVSSGVTLTIKDSGSNGQISNTNFSVITTDDDGNEATKTYAGNGIYVYGTLEIESGTVSGYYGVYVNGGSLTVKESGTVSGSYYGVYQYSGTTEVNGGTVTGVVRGISASAGTVTVSGGSVTGGSSTGIIVNNGTINVTGGTVSSTNYIGIYSNGGTIDISGGEVTGSSSTLSAVYVNAGTVTITGGTISGYRALINWGADITVSGGTLSADSATATIQQTGGTLEITGDAIVTNTGTNSSSTQAIYVKGSSATISGGTITALTGVYVQKGTLTMTGGTINATSCGISTNGTNSEDYYPNTITISGGKVTGSWGMYLPAVESTTTISGTAEIIGSSTGIEIRAGVLNVDGGTITGEASPEDFTFNGSGTTVIGAGIAISQHTTDQTLTVNITGGEISGCYGVFEVNTCENNTSAVTLNVSSDSTSVITGDVAAVYSVSVSGYTSENETYYQNNNTTFSISGGTYNTDVTAYTTSASTAVASTDENGNTVYTVVAVDEGAVAIIVGDDNTVTSYTSLAAAIAAATSGDTITLIKDVTDESNDISDNGLWQIDGKDVTIDLNGKTITSSAKRMFGVLNAGSLTVTNGTVTSTYSSSDVTLIITRDGSTFTAEGVTFNATNHDYLVYAAGKDTVSLTGCTINNVNNAVVKDNSTEATVTLTGCTYTKTPISVSKTNTGTYTIIINSDGGSITSESGAPEIDSNGLVRLDFNYVVEEGGSIETTDTIYLRNDSGAASLTVDGGTVSAAAVEVRDTTTLTTKNGTLTVTGAVTVNDGGTLEIAGAEVSAASINVKSGASMTVSGGTLTVDGNITVQTAEDDKTALTITGGTIDLGTSGQIYSQGSISMTDGTVTGSASKDNGVIYAATGSINISGGTVNVTGTRGVVIDDATGEISGGTFKASSIGLLTRGTDIKISGGTYTATTGLYTKDTTVLSGCVYDNNGNTVTATSSGEYKSTLTDKTVWVGTGVAQIGSTTYGTLQAAITAAGTTESTVILLKSVTEDITVESGQNIILDLAGFTLQNVSDHTITNYGTLTVTDSGRTDDDGNAVTGTVDNITHAKAAIVNYGTAYLYGGTFTRSEEAGTSSSDNGGNSYYTVKNYNEMTIGDGKNTVTVENSGCYSSCVANGYQNASDKTNAQKILNDDTIVPTLTINAGADISGGIATVKNDDEASLTITGGTLSNSNQDVIQNHSTAKISGGTFTATGSADVIYNCGCDESIDQGVLEITGGTFISSEAYPYVLIEVSTVDTAKVSISEGTFTGKIWSSSNSVAEWAIEGGTFSVAVEPKYCAEGFTPTDVDTETGTYTVNSFSLGASGNSDTTVPATIYSKDTTGYTMFVKVSAANAAKYSAASCPTTTEDSSSYVFGGWYTIDSDGNYTEMDTIPDADTTGGIFAKFVNAELLTVQCYVTYVDDGYHWRFVTSVDNGEYQSAGFDVTSNGSTVNLGTVKYYRSKYTITNTTTKVEAANGNTPGTATEKTGGVDITVNEFNRLGANYIVTAATAATENTTFTVTPYWVTADGTKVYGEETTFIYDTSAVEQD